MPISGRGAQTPAGRKKTARLAAARERIEAGGTKAPTRQSPTESEEWRKASARASNPIAPGLSRQAPTGRVTPGRRNRNAIGYARKAWSYAGTWVTPKTMKGGIRSSMPPRARVAGWP